MTPEAFRPVVAGVDGSPDSRAAVRWAVGEARRRQVRLRLVHGYVHPERAADALLAAAAAGIEDVPVERALVRGGPSGVLVDESATASLVVLGARGQGGFTGLRAGSVATQVAAHAHGPVVVVRHDAVPSTGPVVVGVDGSAESTAALGFAFELAAGYGRPLVAVYAWRALPTGNLGPVTVWHYDLAEATEEAARLLAEQVAGWSEKYPDLPVERQALLSFNAAETLVDASRTAGLVVVGCRGRGGFAGLLLGSVSRALVHHAHSPLAVVHLS
jgi:nucleotide-binding universal stress UspA family protein